MGQRLPDRCPRRRRARPRSPEAIAAARGSPINGERPQRIGFAVDELPGLRPIGVANVRDFVSSDGTAEFGIAVGDPADRGKGYGTDATRLVLDDAFAVLGVHNVWLDTAASNTAAIRADARAGFQEIGRRREARRVGDRREDVVLMDCLATEFVPPSKRALPVP